VARRMSGTKQVPARAPMLGLDPDASSADQAEQRARFAAHDRAALGVAVCCARHWSDEKGPLARRAPSVVENLEVGGTSLIWQVAQGQRTNPGWTNHGL
jgi:hypothetical protein